MNGEPTVTMSVDDFLALTRRYEEELAAERRKVQSENLRMQEEARQKGLWCDLALHFAGRQLQGEDVVTSRPRLAWTPYLTDSWTGTDDPIARMTQTIHVSASSR